MNKPKFVLPYNLLAEKTVLGTIINHPDSINFVSQILTVDAFYLPVHQNIYKAALIINTNNIPVDLLTITTWLQDNNLIDEIGGLETLINLSEKIVSFINLKEYTELIKEKYIRRLIISFGEDLVTWGYQTNLTLEKIFTKIEKKIFNLNQKFSYNNISTTAEILTDIFSDLNKKVQNLSFSAYSSQFFDLDAMTQGFQKSDLIVIAGRPAMGKTAFSLNIALDICFHYNLPVIFFSLEMTKQQLVYRLLAIETQITTSRLKLGNLSRDEWPKINKSLKHLSSLPLYIDDTPNLSLTEIHLKIQKIKLQFGSIGLVIIDYLQLLETVKKLENRVQEISQITRNLKGFAREFDTPIIILSQLSRNVESRNNKRPILSDLRESGCIHLTNSEFINYLNNKKTQSERTTLELFSLSQFKLQNSLLFKCQFTGLKITFNIKTHYGLSIFATSTHQFFYQNLWIKLIRGKKNALLKTNLSQFFKKNLYKTIISETVKNIKYANLKNVYDFEVVKNKNFLKNGFILHNSIEQDADIVLMLYRDEYYNEQTKDKNIAEIIIAKHRNGPIGTVKLYFDSYLTKFFNNF